MNLTYLCERSKRRGCLLAYPPNKQTRYLAYRPERSSSMRPPLFLAEWTLPAIYFPRQLPYCSTTSTQRAVPFTREGGVHVRPCSSNRVCVPKNARRARTYVTAEGKTASYSRWCFRWRRAQRQSRHRAPTAEGRSTCPKGRIGQGPTAVGSDRSAGAAAHSPPNRAEE